MNKYSMSFGLRAAVGERYARAVSHALPNGLWFWLVSVIILASGALYVFAVNQTAAQGYRTNSIEQRVEEVRSENKKIEIKIAELQSTQVVTERLANQNFVPVIRIEYVTAGAPSVALK